MAIQQTTPDEAHKLLDEGYRYVDVRTEAEFSNGHPATAVSKDCGAENSYAGLRQYAK